MTPKTQFAQFYLKVNFVSCWQKQVFDTGDEAGMKPQKKINNFSLPEIGTFSATTAKVSLANLKLKFWGYNEKNLGFHLPRKSITPDEPWGMRM